MKILFLDWKCFGRDDTIFAFKNMGHEVCLFYHEDYNAYSSEAFAPVFNEFVEKHKPDAAFSYNYFPVMAQACKDLNLKYISFMYDSPYTYLYSYTLMYPTNYVFVFDRSWVEEFNRGGLTNVYYMALPSNPDKASKLMKKSYDAKRVKSDVSFIGRLYNEKHNFYERLEKNASEYLKGYLDGICEVQQKIVGASIVEGMLTEDILEQMKKALPLEDEGVEPKGYRYANYFIKRKVTQKERMNLLSLIGEDFGEHCDIKLFTEDPNVRFKGIANMGVTDNETEMPIVFANSRINLNISLRSITTGIPLRCMDIMASGGFLLSNYQEDLLTDFEAGSEFDFYTTPEELLDKIDYYLTHEKERAEIARAGQDKIKDLYTFEKVFERIFEIVGQ